MATLIHIPLYNRRYAGNVPVGINGRVVRIPVGVDYAASDEEVEALRAAGVTIQLMVVPNGMIIIPSSRYGSRVPVTINGTTIFFPTGTYIPTPTAIQLEVMQRAGIEYLSSGSTITLGTLTLSGELRNGTPSSGTIIGATAGSSIAKGVVIAGLTINSAARTYTWDGTGAAAVLGNGLIETLAGAINSPKDSPVTILSNPATFPALVPAALDMYALQASLPAQPAVSYVPIVEGVHPERKYTTPTGYFLSIDEMETVSAKRAIVIQANDVSRVQVTIGSMTVDAIRGVDPDSGLPGYIFTVESGAANGWVNCTVKLYPEFSGIPAVFTYALHINTNPAGTGYVQTKTVYIDDTLGLDTNDGTAEFQGAGNVGPFKTMNVAINATPITGGVSSKNTIWRFYAKGALTRGGLQWVGGNFGAVGGNRKIFLYRPIFEGKSKAETYIFVPGLGGTWNAAEFGSKANGGVCGVFKNLTLDLGEILIKAQGARFYNCRVTDSYGPNREKVLGYPKGIWDGVFGGGGINIGVTGRWDCSSAPEPRWSMHDCDLDMYETGSIQVKTKCREQVPYDSWFVGEYGNWAHYGNVTKQVGNGEATLHSTDWLVVASVDSSSGTYTDLTFEAGPTISDLGTLEVGNTFLRILEDPNPAIISGQEQYPINPDGTRDYPYLGYRMAANGWNNPVRRIQGVVPISVGAKVMAYFINHGDMGQWANPTRLPLENRANFSRTNCRLYAHSWQPYLTGGAFVNAAGTQLLGVATVTGLSFTCPANSDVGTISMNGVPGVPTSFMKLFDSLTYTPIASGNNSRYIVEFIDVANGIVRFNKPWTNVTVSSSAVYVGRTIRGFREVGCVLYKSGERAEFGQLSQLIIDFGFYSCSYPGFASNGACLGFRTGGYTNSALGGSHWGIRFVDTIMHSFGTGGPTEPLPVGGLDAFSFENCWIEEDGNFPIQSANIVGTLGKGTVWGGTSISAFPRGIVPDSNMNKTVITQIVPEYPAGVRIGAIS